MTDDPWLSHIPERYQPGRVVAAEVVRIHNFGITAELEPAVTGTVHISEWSDEMPACLNDVVRLGQKIRVMILRVDADERKIGLSRKRARTSGDLA